MYTTEEVKYRRDALLGRHKDARGDTVVHEELTSHIRPLSNDVVHVKVRTRWQRVGECLEQSPRAVDNLLKEIQDPPVVRERHDPGV